MMTSKEFLSQAYHIDQRINSKLEQIKSLHALAVKATSTLSPTPPGENPNLRRMEDTIIKILDLEAEVNADIDSLVDLKRELASAIAQVDNPTYRTLLELRYLCQKEWEDIAVALNYDYRYLLKVHDRAVNQVDTKRHLKTT